MRFCKPFILFRMLQNGKEIIYRIALKYKIKKINKKMELQQSFEQFIYVYFIFTLHLYVPADKIDCRYVLNDVFFERRVNITLSEATFSAISSLSLKYRPPTDYFEISTWMYHTYHDSYIFYLYSMTWICLMRTDYNSRISLNRVE